jgi:type IV secretion system protein VirD4
MRARKLSVVFVFMLVCLSVQVARAAIFGRCDPIKMESQTKLYTAPGPLVLLRAQTICAKENAVYDKWEPIYVALYKIDQQMTVDRQTKPVNWKDLETQFDEAIEIFHELLAAADKFLGQDYDAGTFVAFKTNTYRMFFQNVQVTPPPTYGQALSWIKAGLAKHDQKAASIAQTFVAQFYGRLQPGNSNFVTDLAKAAGNKERRAQIGGIVKTEVKQSMRKAAADPAKYTDIRGRLKSNAEIQAEENARIEPTNVHDYISGFWDRVKLLKQGVFWAVLALVIAFLGSWKGNVSPAAVLKAPVMVFAAFLPVWVLQVVFPILPGWGSVLLAFVILVCLWTWTEKHGWNTGFAKETTHGSAKWGGEKDMTAGGHLYEQGHPPEECGFALGRANTNHSRDPRFRHMGHILTCAPTGAGKGIGAVIPNLLDYPGSALVLDIKGENFAVTARARQEMGQEVYVLDPFGITQESHKLNWLDALDLENPDVVGESSSLTEMLVVPDPNERDSHWNETAKDLLRGLILHVCSLPAERRNICEVRRLLTGGKDLLDETLADMAVSDNGFGVVARAANSFLAKASREQGSVLSTAIRHTAFLDDPRVAAILQGSDFSFSDIKRRPMTVYIALPPAKLAVNARLMRGCVGLALAAITGNNEQPRQKVAFFLDEFAQLGHMSAIEDAISLVRGYGAAFWIFVQDLSQLKGVYPKWQTFLANSAKQFFGTADFDTAKYISDSLGQETISFETASRGRQDAKMLGHTGESDHLQGRALLTPDEVMRLGSERPLIFVNGECPYMLQRLNYLVDPEYQGLADPNPYHT